MQAALRYIKVKLRERLHDSITAQGRWLKSCAARILRVLCGPNEPAHSQCVSISCDTTLAENAQASQSEKYHDMGPIQSAGSCMATTRSRRAPLPDERFVVNYPR